MNHIRHIFPMLAFTASMLLGVSIAVTPATAATITYSFSGQVDKVPNQLNPPFTVNTSPTAMSGLMTVSTTDLDTNSNNRFGEYTITNFSLNVEGYTAGNGTFQQVEIRNGLPGQDQFNVAVISPVGPPVGFRSPSQFEIQLHAPGGPGGIGSAFNSDALPTTSPSIASFNHKNQWRLIFVPGGKAGFGNNHVPHSGAAAGGSDSLRGGACGAGRSWRRELAAEETQPCVVGSRYGLQGTAGATAPAVPFYTMQYFDTFRAILCLIQN